MPVTFPVADHPSKEYKRSQYDSSYNEPNAILNTIRTTHKPGAILQSSLKKGQELIIRKNGFVVGVVEAYNKHHNLIIRPDDVWIAILSQLNLYINAHAEELRSKFVEHEGKKTLIVKVIASRLDQVDFGNLAVQMTEQIDQNVKDKSLVRWVLPDFSTTTTNDTVICSVLIMATLKQYFDYEMHLTCGIPFITLEGTQEDWQSILDRTEKLSEFGEEPTEWAGMLRAVLKRFVHAFDDGGPQADKDFWERMVHETRGGSSTPYISGWITAFCAWDSEGVYFKSRKYQDGFNDDSMTVPQWVFNLKFDGIWFPRVNEAPKGYAEVDVKVVNHSENKEYDCTMLAGHVAITMDGEDKQRLDTVRIAPQWFMYVKGEDRATAERREIEEMLKRLEETSSSSRPK